jgi:hypothetical protein
MTARKIEKDIENSTVLWSSILSDFESIKNKWAINKIHRTIILDNHGKLKMLC